MICSLSSRILATLTAVGALLAVAPSHAQVKKDSLVLAMTLEDADYQVTACCRPEDAIAALEAAGLVTSGESYELNGAFFAGMVSAVASGAIKVAVE